MITFGNVVGSVGRYYCLVCLPRWLFGRWAGHIPEDWVIYRVISATFC